MASNITETSFEVDFSKLPGSKAGYLYLYATDGVNTSECNSYEVQVPYKVSYEVPEIISEQNTIPDYKLTDEIVFDADVYDMQDGWLYTDDEISWSHNGRDDTTGSLLWVYPFELTPGKHDFTMTATNSEGASTSPDYEEGLVTDCGADDYEQFLMVKLGVMEAEGGKFKPNGQLTEQEAATIMYQVLALADPNLVESSTDAQVMVDSCTLWGVMDETGENSYSAEKPITGQLALVRCNRMYDAIFITE